MTNQNTVQRFSPQRQLILDYLKSALAHPTAEQIFQAMRKKMPHISFGTVYRNLDILEKQGEIGVLYYHQDYARYDAVPDNHYHFICQNCDKVEDLIFEEVPDINEQVSKRHNLAVKYHKLFFYGICEDCEKCKIISAKSKVQTAKQVKR